jgi:hypothetical protein
MVLSFCFFDRDKKKELTRKKQPWVIYGKAYKKGLEITSKKELMITSNKAFEMGNGKS